MKHEALIAAPPRRAAAASSRGFTLLEVMFSILILGIGLVAVAGLFPIAGALQRDTIDQAVGQSLAISVNAFLRGKGVSGTTLNGFIVDNAVHDLTNAQLDALGLSLRERCFPSNFDGDKDGVYNTSAADDPTFVARQFYWRPLFRKDTNNNWQVFVFIMKRVPNGGEPTIAINDGVTNAGDVVVATDGTVFTVTNDNDHADCYHALVTGNFSPFKQITILGNGVVR
jgi:prepilin-type N-terminal cleavage/methylation domain-containing protein